MLARVNGIKRLATVALVAVVAFLALMPPQAMACAVCYGEPDAPASKGLTWAIVALGGIVGVVLSGVIMFFVHTGRNAAALEAKKEEE